MNCNRARSRIALNGGVVKPYRVVQPPTNRNPSDWTNSKHFRYAQIRSFHLLIRGAFEFSVSVENVMRNVWNRINMALSMVFHFHSWFFCVCVFIPPWNSSREKTRHSHTQIFYLWSLIPRSNAEYFHIRTNTAQYIDSQIQFSYFIHFLRAEHLVLPRFINSKTVLMVGILFFVRSFKDRLVDLKITLKWRRQVKSGLLLFVNFVLNFGGQSNEAPPRSTCVCWFVNSLSAKYVCTIVAYFLSALLKCSSFLFPDTDSMTFLPFSTNEWYAARDNCRAPFQCIIKFTINGERAILTLSCHK